MAHTSFVKRIVSGGQTGADRAALDWASAHGVNHGGWCPRGRKAEDGPLDTRYCLQETESENYRQRTKRNVEDSDGTLIVNLGDLDGGSLFTQQWAEKRRKPCFLAQVDALSDRRFPEEILAWLQAERIEVLNVAGPRESKRPGIYKATWDLLNAMLALRDKSAAAGKFQLGDGSC